MTGSLRDLARRHAMRESSQEIEEATGLSADTIRALASSDAFKALVREEVIRLSREGGDG